MLGGFQHPQGPVELSQLVLGEGSPMLQKTVMLISMIFTLNLLLGVFNLLPFPPLDGATVLALFMPPNKFRNFLGFVRHPHFGLMGMLIAWMIFPNIFSPILNNALYFIYLWG